MINIKRLLQTRDDDLLKEFPDYTRGELRRLKRDNKPTPKPPKILIFDTENSQMETKVWQLKGNLYIDPKRITKDWCLLCYSAKWLGSNIMIHDRLTSKEAINKDDKRISKSLWELLDETDMVVAHNGDAFDIKKANARFLKHNLNLPSPYRSIDTLKIARKYFKLPSNTLDYICKYLEIPRKLETGGIKLWDDCELGDEQALKKMDIYCRNDVKILEEVYLRLRPYDKSHPNLGVYLEDKSLCNNCGAGNLKQEGFYTTQFSMYKIFRCKCGAINYSKIKV